MVTKITKDISSGLRILLPLVVKGLLLGPSHLNQMVMVRQSLLRKWTASCCVVILSHSILELLHTTDVNTHLTNYLPSDITIELMNLKLFVPTRSIILLTRR